MKCCFKCHVSKPMTEFYRHPEMADGHLNKCKTCAKADASNHRQNSLEKVQDYDRKRGRTDERRESTKRHRSSNPGWRKKSNILTVDEVKVAVRSKVTVAVRAGTLIKRPCEMCGAAKVEAHHEDYSNPMDVVWLCRMCHGKRHQEINDYRREMATMLERKR